MKFEPEIAKRWVREYGVPKKPKNYKPHKKIRHKK
jgi:hypothetical protein